jgi:glycosyltransferase involved in cell wall biosynthesis
MKIIFFHDNVITVREQFLFSSGSLNSKVISRYLELSDKFSLATRKDNSRSTENLTLVGSLKDLNHFSLPNLASFKLQNLIKCYKDLSKLIYENNFMIIRLPSLIGLLALHIAKKQHKNYLIELVGCPLDSYRLHSFIGKIISIPMYFITRFYVKNAESVLYVTDSFLQNRYPTNTSQQIGCSDVELVIDNKVLAKRMEKIDSKSKDDFVRIGMIGFLEAKYKGFKTALKALSLIKNKGNTNYFLEIVGGGNSLYITNLVKELGLDNQVNIIGTLSHPNGIMNWLDSIDIYLQPSSTEGMPRALIEAMSRACACIGSNAGEIPELLEYNHVHKKNDFKKLSQSILELSDSSNMKLNSKNKFLKSKEFNKKILDEKRYLFYNESINY